MSANIKIAVAVQTGASISGGITKARELSVAPQKNVPIRMAISKGDCLPFRAKLRVTPEDREVRDDGPLGIVGSGASARASLCVVPGGAPSNNLRENSVND